MFDHFVGLVLKRLVTAQSHMCGALRNLVPFAQFKTVKNTHEGVLLLVKLQAETCN